MTSHMGSRHVTFQLYTIELNRLFGGILAYARFYASIFCRRGVDWSCENITPDIADCVYGISSDGSLSHAKKIK